MKPSRMKSIYIRADIYLFPSLYNNTPLVPQEAAKTALSDTDLYLRVAKNTQKALRCRWGNVIDEVAQKY